MNDRQRILSLFAGERPDRVPWFGDLAYWASAMEQRGDVPPDWQRTPDYYRFHRELGVGFYLQGYFAFEPHYDDTVQVEETEAEGIRRQRVLTPVGELVAEWRFLPRSAAWAPVQHMIRSRQDLTPLRYWWEHTSFLPAPQEAERRRFWVDDLGLVLCYLPRSPFMELTAVLAGIRTLVDLWVEEPAEFEETLDVLSTAFDRAAEAALNVPADCFMIPENLSSEVVGRRFYERFVQPWERKWVTRLHQAGKPAFIHMDGTLRGLLRPVAETGFDVIEAVTPAPVGDVAIEELRALAGPGPILWGGLPGVYFTSLVSEEEFERHVRHVLQVMVEDRRMVLGVADQVPPDGLLRRVARVVQLVEQYGRYP
ncbi:MAG: hypothetical protein H5T69_13950 [Chloroflexi bacterium]|nr:hypothetical protein [Chloroflexota bacterium]